MKVKINVSRNRLGRLVSLHELGPDHPWPAARIHGPKQLADDPLLSELTKRRH